jgi:hypothetical protein
MKENELEPLLEKICQEQIDPSEHLVAYTKQMLKVSRFLNVVIYISLFFNALVTVSAAVVLFLPGLTWADKLLWYFGTASFFNGFIVLMLLNREKVTAFFHEFIYTVNHSI